MHVSVLSLDQLVVGVSLAVPGEEKAILSKDKQDVVEVSVIADRRVLQQVTWIQIEARLY